jgi:hypothetical protein
MHDRPGEAPIEAMRGGPMSGFEIDGLGRAITRVMPGHATALLLKWLLGTALQCHDDDFTRYSANGAYIGEITARLWALIGD